MISRRGRYVLVFNGEIYNFAELREELELRGETFRGTSDTEVLLAGIEVWGVWPTLRRVNGMFAIGIWDSVDRSLTIARDRYGEKPLYYAWMGQAFLFGSELKALVAFPGFRREIDSSSVEKLLMLGYIPGPHCIYRGVAKLMPACGMSVAVDGHHNSPVAYWKPSEMLDRRCAPALTRSESATMLDVLLRRAVKARMVADVPLGAFLSGGIDSSTIVALMQTQSRRPIKTFTIGFSEAEYNEASDAKRVAAHIGTDHHEHILSSRECTSIIPCLQDIYDEPFADSSQIPTVLVSAFTRKHVTVVLTGDAGDELFGGYNRYFWAMRLWGRLRRLPRLVRSMSQNAIRALPPQTWEAIVKAGGRLFPKRYRVRSGGDKMYKIARMLDAGSVADLYIELISNGHRAHRLLREHSHWDSHLRGWQPPHGLAVVEQMMLVDQQTYLIDDILCKVDRASMAVGLEARVPFLANEVVEFAWSLPDYYKVCDGVGKWPVREVLKRYVPPTLFNRPKMGFGIPIGQWLRGDLREWAETLLSPVQLEADGLFATEEVRTMWREHTSGRVNFAAQLWPVLMFLAWRQRWS